jgi:hypothetical protein
MFEKSVSFSLTCSVTPTNLAQGLFADGKDYWLKYVQKGRTITDLAFHIP